MLRVPLGSRARCRIRLLRGQHHEAKSCSFTTGVGQAVGERRIRFSRLHRSRTAGIAERDDARFVSFVVSTTKQSRAPSLPESVRLSVSDEADSVAFTAHVRLASPRGTMPDSSPSWSAPRSKVVLLRLKQITSGEAPSWSFGEASPNDREGASVAFTGGTWCASDHTKPRMKGHEFASP